MLQSLTHVNFSCKNLNDIRNVNKLDVELRIVFDCTIYDLMRIWSYITVMRKNKDISMLLTFFVQIWHVRMDVCICTLQMHVDVYDCLCRREIKKLTVTVVYLRERLNVYCARNQKGHTTKLARAIFLLVHIIGCFMSRS